MTAGFVSQHHHDPKRCANIRVLFQRGHVAPLELKRLVEEKKQPKGAALHQGSMRKDLALHDVSGFPPQGDYKSRRSRLFMGQN